MRLTYLPKWAYFLFAISLIFFTMIFDIFGFLLVTLVFIAMILIFRSAGKDLREDSSVAEGIIISPVNGRVVKINKNIQHDFFGEDYTCVIIQVPFWKQLGLFFPATSEIEEVQAAGEKSTDHLVKFRLPSGLDIGLAVGQNILKILPKIVVLPGDRGKQKMNFGYLPFGGVTKVYIPSSLEVLINEKDEVVAGQGVLAGIPKNIED